MWRRPAHRPRGRCGGEPVDQGAPLVHRRTIGTEEQREVAQEPSQPLSQDRQSCLAALPGHQGPQHGIRVHRPAAVVVEAVGSPGIAAVAVPPVSDVELLDPGEVGVHLGPVVHPADARQELADDHPEHVPVVVRDAQPPGTLEPRDDPLPHCGGQLVPQPRPSQVQTERERARLHECLTAVLRQSRPRLGMSGVGTCRETVGVRLEQPGRCLSRTARHAEGEQQEGPCETLQLVRVPTRGRGTARQDDARARRSGEPVCVHEELVRECQPVGPPEPGVRGEFPHLGGQGLMRQVHARHLDFVLSRGGTEMIASMTVRSRRWQ